MRPWITPVLVPRQKTVSLYPSHLPGFPASFRPRTPETHTSPSMSFSPPGNCNFRTRGMRLEEGWGWGGGLAFFRSFYRRVWMLDATSHVHSVHPRENHDNDTVGGRIVALDVPSSALIFGQRRRVGNGQEGGQFTEGLAGRITGNRGVTTYTKRFKVSHLESPERRCSQLDFRPRLSHYRVRSTRARILESPRLCLATIHSRDVPA